MTSLVLAGAAFIAHNSESDAARSPATFHVESEVDLGRVPFGECRVAFRLTNAGQGAGRVLGYRESCGLTACIYTLCRDPLAVGPGETFTYPCRVVPREVGPFEASLTLFLEDNGVREVTLTVRGNAVSGGGQVDATPVQP